jgi:hypothetical protein
VCRFRRKRHSDSSEEQDQEDRVASPFAPPASVGGAHQAPIGGLQEQVGGAPFDQMGTFPHQEGGRALPLNYSIEGHQQTLLLLVNGLNWDSASRSQPSLLLDSTLRYLSDQHQAPSQQHARLALEPTLLEAQRRLQHMQAMLLPPRAPRLMDSLSYNLLPLLQQHSTNQSFLSFPPNSARQSSSQFESLQSSMLPSTALNRLVEDSLIAAALRRPPLNFTRTPPTARHSRHHDKKLKLRQLVKFIKII